MTAQFIQLHFVVLCVRQLCISVRWTPVCTLEMTSHVKVTYIYFWKTNEGKTGVSKEKNTGIIPHIDIYNFQWNLHLEFLCFLHCWIWIIMQANRCAPYRTSWHVCTWKLCGWCLEFILIVASNTVYLGAKIQGHNIYNKKVPQEWQWMNK